MRRHQLRGLPVILFTICALAAGCGGGESPAPMATGGLSALGWDPPGTYADNAALDPYQDLEYYEVYLNEGPNFSDNDAPVALIKAVTDDPTSGGNGKKLETEFILDNIKPFVVPGKFYYVSLKAVGVDGQKSAFMSPVAWNQQPVQPL